MAGPYPCRDIDLMAFLPHAEIGGGSGNDIWGWTDPLTGREYALVGRSTGTAFVDISNPGQPIYVATGDPVYNLPTSALLAPVIAVPLLAVDGLPVGVQVIGQQRADYRIAGYAQWMMDNLRPVAVA